MRYVQDVQPCPHKLPCNLLALLTLASQVLFVVYMLLSSFICQTSVNFVTFAGYYDRQT